MTTVLPLAPETRTAGPRRRSRWVSAAPEPPARSGRRVLTRAARRRTPWPLVLGDLACAAVVTTVVTWFAISSPSLRVTGALAWVVVLAACGTYRAADAPSWSAPFWSGEARHVGQAALVLAAALPLVTGSGAQAVRPATSASLALLLAGTTATLHLAARRLPVLRQARAFRPIRVVVTGHRRDTERIVAELRSSRFPAYDVVAVCGPDSVRPGEISAVTDTAAMFDADAVMVAPCRHLHPSALRRLGWQLERSGTRLLVATSLLDVTPGRTRLSHAGPLSLVDVRHTRIAGGGRLVKEVVERAAAALGLLVLSPLLLAVAVLVRLDSEGGALFRQVRVGKDGVPFTMLKFRTMSDGAEHRQDEFAGLVSADSILFKLAEDPRTTRVGRILRRYSLDELPQLVNVVRGEMSLVGPRPPMPGEVARYHPDVLRRLAVKPGITGLWQVSGRSDLSWEQSVRLDLRYVDNWSLSADVGILARTVGAVVHHRGAY